MGKEIVGCTSNEVTHPLFFSIRFYCGRIVIAKEVLGKGGDQPFLVQER
jgi:hypothetical protein